MGRSTENWPAACDRIASGWIAGGCTGGLWCWVTRVRGPPYRVRSLAGRAGIEKGITISNKSMRDLAKRHLPRHAFHGEWNYTITSAKPSASVLLTVSLITFVSMSGALSIRSSVILLGKAASNEKGLILMFLVYFMRRAVIRLILVSLLGAAIVMTGLASASPAIAAPAICQTYCSFYGRAYWVPSSTNIGSFGKVEAQCLWVADPTSQFVTSEMWQGTDNSGLKYWIEAGETYGNPNGGTRSWFYARRRPSTTSYDYMQFFPSGTPALGTSYSFEFAYDGTFNNDPQWTIYAPWGSPTIYEEPPYSTGLAAGTEITQSNNRSVGNITGLKWLDSSSQWHTGWPGAAAQDYPPPPDNDTTTTWTGTGDIHYQSSC
jgi:hypothetical protein